MTAKHLGTIIFLLLVVIAASTFWVGASRYHQTTMTVNGYQITVDEPSTSAQFQLGLGGRKGLNENQGMLFIFPAEQALSFWMKGMLIPIDIIWLDNTCRVVHVEASLAPCPQTGLCPIYTPSTPARYVLETKAGFSQLHQIVVGKTIIESSTCTR